MIIVAPSKPWRGLRGTDAWGDGSFEASRDGGTRRHLGQDYMAHPGDVAVWPISGKLIHVSAAYAGSTLRSLIIVGHAEAAGWMARIDYVMPTFLVGDSATAGEPLGRVQDVAGYWQAQHPERGAMTNHVHLEVWCVADPREFIAESPA